MLGLPEELSHHVPDTGLQSNSQQLRLMDDQTPLGSDDPAAIWSPPSVPSVLVFGHEWPSHGCSQGALSADRKWNPDSDGKTASLTMGS